MTLTLRGRLTLRSVPQVREATVKWLLNTGQVVMGLSRLRVTQTAMVSVFPTALDIAGGWPLARLVLFGADATLRSMLKSTRVPDTVPLADDLPAAHVLLHRQPPCVRRYRDLPMYQSAPAAAREFVRGACAAWSVPQDTEELAELVVNELVRGLHLVTAVAHTWGTDQHLDGKTVWAYLAYPADRGTDH